VRGEGSAAVRVFLAFATVLASVSIVIPARAGPIMIAVAIPALAGPIMVAVVIPARTPIMIAVVIPALAGPIMVAVVIPARAGPIMVAVAISTFAVLRAVQATFVALLRTLAGRAFFAIARCPSGGTARHSGATAGATFHLRHADGRAGNERRCCCGRQQNLSHGLSPFGYVQETNAHQLSQFRAAFYLR
jgi:hypothetical protein